MPTSYHNAMTTQPTPNDPLAPLYAQMRELRAKPDEWTILSGYALGNVTATTKKLWISEDKRAENLPLGSLERVVRGLR